MRSGAATGDDSLSSSSVSSTATASAATIVYPRPPRHRSPKTHAAGEGDRARDVRHFIGCLVGSLERELITHAQRNFSLSPELDPKRCVGLPRQPELGAQRRPRDAF